MCPRRGYVKCKVQTKYTLQFTENMTYREVFVLYVIFITDLYTLSRKWIRVSSKELYTKKHF